MENMKQFYESQVEWYKKEIEWNNREIEWLTKQLEMCREEDHKMSEYIWNRGVLTKTEMEIWGGKYEGRDTHKYKLQRRREYLRRKRNYKSLADYEKRLANA